MTLYGAFRLAKALKQAMDPTEQRRRVAKLMEGERRKFYKHADKCKKTNSGLDCNKCDKYANQYWGVPANLKAYRKGLRESPSTTLQPFSVFQDDVSERIRQLKDMVAALTDEKLKEFSLRAMDDAGMGVVSYTEFKVVRADPFGGAPPDYLVFTKDSMKSIVSVKTDFEKEDLVSETPWRSSGTEFDQSSLFGEQNKNWKAAEAWGKEGTDRNSPRYYEQFVESDRGTVIKVYGSSDVGGAYRLSHELVIKSYGDVTAQRISDEEADKFHFERSTEKEVASSSSGSETKECPFCAETIKAKAIVCRFCRRDIPSSI